MGLGVGGTQIINSSIRKITQAKEACAEVGQTIFPAQEIVSENWQGESGTVVLNALNEIWAEINQAFQELLSAESEVREQGDFIINNWTDNKG